MVCRRSQIDGFQSMLSEYELMDLGFKGTAYTWTNNQVGEANIRERLDKAFATMAWRDWFSFAQVFHESIIGSDHYPLIVNCYVPPKRVPQLFKFESICEHQVRSVGKSSRGRGPLQILDPRCSSWSTV